MTLTYDPRKLLKTGQGSRGSKLTLCGLICPKREVKCHAQPDAEGSVLLGGRHFAEANNRITIPKQKITPPQKLMQAPRTGSLDQ